MQGYIKAGLFLEVSMVRNEGREDIVEGLKPGFGHRFRTSLCSFLSSSSPAVGEFAWHNFIPTMETTLLLPVMIVSHTMHSHRGISHPDHPHSHDHISFFLVQKI